MFYTYYKQYGNRILVRYKNKDSKTITKTFSDYKPSLFLKSDEETDYKSIFGYPLKKVEFDNIKSAKSFADQYKSVDNFVLEGNANYANQFMIELFDGKQPEYKPDWIRLVRFDIEVDCDEFPKVSETKFPINAITLHDSIDNIYYVFGVNPDSQSTWDQTKVTDDCLKDLKIRYEEYSDEEALLRNVLKLLSDLQPDIISGWNSEGFDVPYLIKRCYKILGESYTSKLLSPFNHVNERTGRNEFGQEFTKFEIYGIQHLDYQQVYKKHTYVPRESYKLDYISQEELGVGKLDYSEHKNLQSLYRDDYQKFVDYNIIDVLRMVQLDDKLSLFPLIYAISYYSISNYEDTLGTVKLWEQLIAKFLFSKNKVPLFNKQKSEKRDFDGGFVKDPIVGFNEWVISYDLNSLYPHVEMQWNIGLETYVPENQLPTELKELRDSTSFDDLLNKKVNLDILKKHKVTMSAARHFYRLDEMSFFSEIKREIYATRKQYQVKLKQAKKDNSKNLISAYYNMQMGLKILLNSGYGVLGNSSFLYYKIENAESITLSGQLVNRWTASYIEKFLCSILGEDKYWVMGDTDSCYIQLNPLVKQYPNFTKAQKLKLVDDFGKEIIAPKIKERNQELCDYMNCYEMKMVWAREAIADKCIMVAKKKYIMNVIDDEGTVLLDNPKLKLTGVEAIKSAFPRWSRDYLKDCYKICLSGTQQDLYDLLEKIKAEFELKTPTEISIPTSVNGISKYGDDKFNPLRGAPIHVKAALSHNRFLIAKNINHIPPLIDGMKIKWIELKQPNPLRAENIGFDSYFPDEFNELLPYINRPAIFEKSFVAPLRIFLNAIGWNTEEQVTLF